MEKLRQTKEWDTIPAAHKMTFPECCSCGGILEAQQIVLDTFPYNHADVTLICTLCKAKYLFGIPIDPIAGKHLEIFDTDPEKAFIEAENLEDHLFDIHKTPLCIFHAKKMVLTKIFGNQVYIDPKKFRIQFKCPECFLTKHYTITRTEKGGIQWEK